MTAISFLRQMDIFDPASFTHVCHVIGCGAVGSNVAEALCRLGIGKIELYDKDTVSPHNVPTGIFKPAQIGMPKVDAARAPLSEFGGSVKSHLQEVGKDKHHKTKLPGVVFVCVDSMDARRQIWQNCIKQNPEVRLMIETRIGPQEGRVYTIDPLDLQQIEFWEEVSSYNSGHDQQLPCTYRSVISVVDVIVGLAIQQLILWHNKKDLARSIIFSLGSKPFLAAD